MTRLLRDPDHGALQPLLVSSRFDSVMISFGSVSSQMLLLGDGGTRLPICSSSRSVCHLSQLVRSSRTFSCRWWSGEGVSQRLGGHAQERRIMRTGGGFVEKRVLEDWMALPGDGAGSTTRRLFHCEHLRTLRRVIVLSQGHSTRVGSQRTHVNTQCPVKS